jgi:hypothetical protein
MKAGDRSGYVVLLKETEYVVRPTLLQKRVQLTPPQLNRRALASGVILNVLFEW